MLSAEGLEGVDIGLRGKDSKVDEKPGDLQCQLLVSFLVPFSGTCRPGTFQELR